MSHLTAADLSRAHRSWWPWAVLVIVLLGTAATNRRSDLDYPVFGGVLLAVLAAAPAVLPGLTGRRAVAALPISGALCGLYFAAGYSDGPIFLALPTVTFMVATAVPVRSWLPPALAACALMGTGLWLRWLWWSDEPHKSLWQVVGMLGIVMAAGAVATATRNRFEARAERAERTVTEERLRMAQDLHDGVGHGLAVIAMQAGVALHVLDRDPAKARASLEAIRDTSRESLEALRSELAAMAGSAPRRPSAGLEDLPALLERVRAAGLRVDVAGGPGQLPDPVAQVAYVVVQEALTNVLRHAAATSATVEWTRGVDRVVLAVRDDGRGGAVQDEGMGISGMRARVTALGGSLRAGPVAGGGFEVVAELPG
ncbi:sensor histidine kinase [Nocardioides bizhenqiangii]|uniref:histidine kinase n=1 Tax=Nocardioides bizhenqiangii TaxID=3095076 RepID=A0ABZ0ZS63_9ACTN|nr:MULTISPECIES: histidine kinase [unclassified Nocardioides]MDZ5622833.1 histidine kinase [Nocardioides sp. HM23]WQQ27093.1 histidine kinase [Nocardioides sp. HM61]